VLLGQKVAQPPAGVEQPRADGRLGDRGDLARPRRAQLLDLAQHERLALRDRQAVERRFETDPEQDAYRAAKQSRLLEQQRQNTLTDEAKGYLDKTQQAVTPQATEANREAAEQSFMKLYDTRGTTQPEGQYLSGQDNATDMIKEEIAKRAATAARDARSRVQALAKVGSFDSAMAQNGLAMQDNSSLLNTLGGIRRGSLAVNKQEQNIQPNQVLPSDSILPQLLTAGGSMVSGMSGTPGGFGGFTYNPTTGESTQNWGIFNNMFGKGGLFNTGKI